MPNPSADESIKLTRWQRAGLKKLRRLAGRGEGEPLQQEDWEAVWKLHAQGSSRVAGWFLRTMPRSPRCGICGAPFAGVGSRVVRPFGYRPSRKNPTVCATCVELSPPGGMNMHTGILFADLRGFTSRFEEGDPGDAARLLRRFYRCAEDVLFPDAVIDKVIGDEVMALYLPDLKSLPHDKIPGLMLEHARGLLRAVGYGSPDGPFVEMGIGMDVGEAFVGNIGQRALFDFTAVGDVVNTASRLQGHAASGEVVLSHRVAHGLSAPVGSPVELRLKGKSTPEPAYRVRVSGTSGAAT
jgi:adenylate cyclase